MSKLMKEFRDFAVKGNMIDMAVGMIIGAAFKDIVNSLVNNVVMPVLSLFTGKLDFSNMFISLNGEEYATLAAAQEAGAPTLNYGLFITGVINFLLMAFVIFLVIRQLNKAKQRFEKPVEAAAPTEKECPYCKTMININATRCPHCTSKLTEE